MPKDVEGDDEEETVYDEEGREELVDDEEISPEEAGFMQGYDSADESEEEESEEKESEEKESKEKESKEKEEDFEGEE